MKSSKGDKMKNFEYIKQKMSVDEMAEFIAVYYRCRFCIIGKRHKSMTDAKIEECERIGCKEGCKQWLLSECEV